MVAARTEACLATGVGGVAVGILTATDVARRVVAAGITPAVCRISEVMTQDPHTVTSDDSAADALSKVGPIHHPPPKTNHPPPTNHQPPPTTYHPPPTT